MLSAFYIRLHEKYTRARNQIMLMKPIPDVRDILSMIMLQERQFSVGLGS